MFKKVSVKLLAFVLTVVMVFCALPLATLAETAGTSGSDPIASVEYEHGSVTNYEDFMKNLKDLEKYAAAYALSVGRDAGELVLNFIRTGVERYQDDNWTTLAGQEIVGFTSYVAGKDAENGTTAMNLKDIVIKNFVLPNGNQVDFGHMFGCMNISYVNKGSADLSGWSGDLCDLLQYSVAHIDEINKNTDGSIEQMAAYIKENCFGVDASGAFGWDDFYGDMDAYYLITEYKRGSGSFSSLMEAYFTADLNDVDRTVYFMNNRFAVADSSEAVRKAIYDAYSSDVSIKILESGRGLSSYNTLRQACCYAFADYVYSQAQGKLIEGTVSDDTSENGYYSVFSSTHSILAPGITQDINYAQTVDGKQIVYYVATVDVTRDDVTIMVNYNNNQPPVGSNIGMQSVANQTAALVENYRNLTDENGNKVYENFNAIVATNGAGYNITTGTPSGLVVMNGVEYYPVSAPGFFAILKDGTAMIGTKADYEANKEQIKEGIAAFGSVLIKNGKIDVTKSANYTSSRASRTAIGITAEGKVVMMVLDGRQLPRSAGGAMEEIAQIMLEAGCVQAVNLDGGGSSTYLSKPAGKDDIELVNVPSDGYARSVATSLVAISTAAPSTAFDHAVISSDYEYITAGTSMQFTATGVSNTGNAAPIPAGAYWRVSDNSLGYIDTNGKFTATAHGDITVEYMVGGEVKGSKVIHIVIPDSIKFVEDRITAVYGVPKTIGVTVWYQGNPVAFTPLVDAFVFFNYEFDKYGQPILYFESNAGYINGLEFVGNDSKKVRTVPVYAALLVGNSIIATQSSISLYYADEATFDFENATQGNNKLAWNREIENATSTDNQLYRISDPNSPVEIDYTFALDMTAIDFPAHLEPLKEMLPTQQAGATAWTYLLQLAERVCTQTNVTIRAEFSKELDVDISALKIVNDYFTLTKATLDANNVLTVVCNWKNQSKPIDPTTANPLCILSGIKATVKDTAAYFNNEILVANNGTVTYDIYLAASSLYSFASDVENQRKYGLYPYIHEEDCRSDFSDADDDEAAATNNDKGAHFSGQYMDFADIYIINNEIRQGWHEEGNDYYFYKDNEPLTGVQLVPDRHNSAQDRFYEFDESGKLLSEDGTTGLIFFGGDLYYAVLGVAQTGWQQLEGKDYYFHPDTGKALNGVQKIRENIYANDPGMGAREYTYKFVDYVLAEGEMVYDTEGKYGSGYRYRWAGQWTLGCWFEYHGNTYHVEKNYPYFITTGYGHYIHDFKDGDSTGCYLFDEKGVFLGDYTGPASIGNSKTAMFKNGVLYTAEFLGSDCKKGLIQGSDGYYYFISSNWDAKSIVVNQSTWVGTLGGGGDYRNGINIPEATYTFDAYGRLTKALISDSIISNTAGAAVQIIGSVITVTNDIACKVAYKNAAGEYVILEAMVNPYQTAKSGETEYNFAIPTDAKEVKIMVSGDVSGNGTADADDVNTIYATILGREGGLDESDALIMALADVNGDGKVSTLDAALLNAARLGKAEIRW